MPRERRRSGENEKRSRDVEKKSERKESEGIEKGNIQSSVDIVKPDSNDRGEQRQHSGSTFTGRKRSSGRNKEVSEEKYKSEEEHYLTKNQILNRVEEIMKAERGMKFFIRTKGWAHLSEHIIHAADVSKYIDIFKECISDDSYVDARKSGERAARIVNIVKF